MATATKTFYSCSACGTVYSRWMGQCTDCGAWDTLQEEKASPRETRKGTLGKRKKLAPEIQTLSTVRTDTLGVMATGVSEFDNVLGGGAMPGSTVLIGGEPGIGKSTLLLQVAGRLAQRGLATLYVSGEESPAQIKRRADRLEVKGELNLLAAVDLTGILAAADQNNPRVLIIDSIQTTLDPQMQSAPGTVSQVRECTSAISDWVRTHDAVAFIVGHVTKEGFIAGPKVLEHLVDTVLQFEGDRRQWVRILRCLKNRYGSTHEVGLFEMAERGLKELSDPTGHFLSGDAAHGPGSAVAVALEGRRPLLLEIQALVGNGGGVPQRVMSGLDQRRVAILIAVLQNIAGVQLAGRDVYTNIIGGYMTDEPAVDLAIAMAIASSALKRTLPQATVFIGEVGLSGDIRNVPQLNQRLAAAEKVGFKQAVVPKIDLRDIAFSGELDLHPVATISQCLEIC